MTDQSTISPHEKSHTPFAPVDPGVRMGHVHLKVADIDQALAFYSGILGFQVTQRLGSQAALNRGGRPPQPGTTGLYHLAILYPTRAALADALRRLIAAKIPARRRLRPRRERGTLSARPR